VVSLGGPIKPAYHEVAHRVRRAITSGKLAPGARLPSESELCATFEVSRDTVRRGLLLLAEEGLILGQQGAGWFVAEGQRK